MPASLDPAAAALRLAAPGSIGMLCPFGLLWGESAEAAIAQGRALPFLSGPRSELPAAFTVVKLLMRTGAMAAQSLLPAALLLSWIDSVAREAGIGAKAELQRQLECLMRARAPFAGIARVDRPAVMGIVNVTPDSFSDGGAHATTAAAIVHGRRLAAEGADLIDIGGESTRPGAEPVPVQQEMDRVLPVVEALASEGLAVSVDTRRAAVMTEAARLGARVFNDVTGFTNDDASVPLIESTKLSAVAMHMQGEPATMQNDPRYVLAPLDVAFALGRRLDAVPNALADGRVAVDPGIGFGKTLRHNLDLLAHLALLHGLGAPIVLGASRKSFISRLSQNEPAGPERLPGSLAAAVAAAAAGVQMLRVHDVAATVQALAVDREIRLAA